MARLLPKIDPETIENKPERDVARELVNSLPDNVLVIHSYPWLRRQAHDKGGAVRLQEGEADFVILWPDKGLMVVEVKGGDIDYDEQRMLWLRIKPSGEKKIITDPFWQAEKNLHALKDKISDSLFSGGQLSFIYGYLVCFPDCRYEGPVPAGADPIIILSAPDLSRMNERIGKAYIGWNPTTREKSFPMDLLKKVERAILPKFNILPILFRTIEAQEESLFRLTKNQLEVLEFLNNRPRALVEGVAGSGKTMMARVQTERFADNNLKSLLICYNKNLAVSLKEDVADEYKDLIHVVHFHKLCRDWCDEAGIPFTPDGDPSFWKMEAANLLFDAIEHIERRYDAIIIDEGQDFLSDWWEPIEYLLQEPNQGHLYVFYDPAQNLFNDEQLTLPALGEPFKLPMNCRNTKEIASTCSSILKYPINTRHDAPKGIATEWFYELDDSETTTLLNNVIKNWLVKESIDPSQIAILSPVRLNNSSLKGEQMIGGATILTQDKMKEWRKNMGVLYSTIRAFKGLEADIVIMIDVNLPEHGTPFSPADFYVGCSRAKHILKIVTSLKKENMIQFMPEKS